jgi:hypothetical protein
MNIEQANGIALPEILKVIDCKHVKQVNEEIWYNSPFRDEKTASFHVNTVKNVWYDFGMAKGGDVVAFAKRYLESQNEDCTVVDALRWLRNMMIAPTLVLPPKGHEVGEKTSKILVQAVSPIKHAGLIAYLEERGIRLETAQNYLREVLLLNHNTGKMFTALCLENEGEGYELRNQFFKGCTGPKSISFIRGTKLPAEEINLFEGFFDFLSVVQSEPDGKFEGDVIILNSLACLPQAVPYISNYHYKTVRTYLDNDDAGNSTTMTLKELAKVEGCAFKPMNESYAPFKDVNECHVAKIEAAKKKAKPKLKPKPKGAKNVKA